VASSTGVSARFLFFFKGVSRYCTRNTCSFSPSVCRSRAPPPLSRHWPHLIPLIFPRPSVLQRYSRAHSLAHGAQMKWSAPPPPTQSKQTYAFGHCSRGSAPLAKQCWQWSGSSRIRSSVTLRRCTSERASERASKGELIKLCVSIFSACCAYLSSTAMRSTPAGRIMSV
jgi:hypothetical protein